MPASIAPSRPSGLGTRTWLFAGLTLLVCLLALTTRSFWIDECYSARFAQQPTLTACWQLLREIKGSDPQMPLYILWIWTCEKFTGASELALRAVNLFWLLPALAALALAFTGNRQRQTTVFLAAIFSPFIWYYLNEARGYTMQFSTSLILFATIVHWCRNEKILLHGNLRCKEKRFFKYDAFSLTLPSPAGRGNAFGYRGEIENIRLDNVVGLEAGSLQSKKSSAAVEWGWAVGFAVALFCLCGSSLLAMVLAGAPLLLTLTALPGKRLTDLGRHFWPLWLAAFGALFALGLYYLWSLHSGDRGTDIAQTGWKNLVFIGYELSGFAGLGPGRLEIRTGGNDVFVPYAAGLIPYAVLVMVLAGLAILDLRQKFGVKRLAAMMLAVGLPAGLVLAASAVSHFRLLGRHCSGLLPVAILLLGLGAASAWRRGWAGKIVVIVFFTFYLASALSLRFAERHEKDNYRAAATAAKTALATGKTVWWNADLNAAIYYQVPIVKTGGDENGHARWVIHSTQDTLAGAQPPDVVITSRRDVYDESGALADFLTREHYRAVTNYTAFIVWRRGTD